MFPRYALVPIARFTAPVMLFVAVADVQKGMPAEQADLIPAAQLAPGSLGTSTNTAIWITSHLDMVTGTDYGAASYTTPLRLDGLTFPRR